MMLENMPLDCAVRMTGVGDWRSGGSISWNDTTSLKIRCLNFFNCFHPCDIQVTYAGITLMHGLCVFYTVLSTIHIHIF